MGKGTIAFNHAPAKKVLYGDSNFYLRPIYRGIEKGKEEFFFVLRPSQEPGYLFEVEGEFGIGSTTGVKKDIAKGEYDNTKYYYYKFEVEKMSSEQKKIILNWAIDGAL